MSQPAQEEDIESLAYAQNLDKKDALRHLREQFIIPSKADLKRTTLDRPGKLVADEHHVIHSQLSR